MKTIDSFSFRRSLGMYRFYRGSIVRQLLIYLGLTVAIYLLMVLLLSHFSIDTSIRFYGILSIAIAYMVYVSPVVFAGRDDTLMNQLPVTPGEKTVFYVLYTAVFMILFVQGAWFLLCRLGGLVFRMGEVDEIMKSQVFNMIPDISLTTKLRNVSLVSNYFQTAAIVIVSLYVVLVKRSHTVLKCFLAPIVILIGLGIISGIAGVIVGLSSGLADVKSGEVDPASTEQLVQAIISGLQPVVLAIGLLTVAACIILTVKIFRRFKHPRVY